VAHDVIHTSADDTLPPFDPVSFWTRFRHGTALVAGVRLHFVEGGEGAPILLLPGWPQSWYVWRYVMPLLASAGRRVIALDPRGMGDSDRPASGYDMGTVAAEIHGFVEALGLRASGPLDVVGHDVGTWIGYAYAADWPSDVRRLALFDAALPGISPPPAAGIPSADVNLRTWHFAFNRLDDLPEILLAGREREFLTWLFRAKAVRRWAITATDLEEYVRVNGIHPAWTAVPPVCSTFRYWAYTGWRIPSDPSVSIALTRLRPRWRRSHSPVWRCHWMSKRSGLIQSRRAKGASNSSLRFSGKPER
jgi:pimeloyl-ACP methyl ester carboxylesterase